jgi:serine/threonine protein phosphatase PrpC
MSLSLGAPSSTPKAAGSWLSIAGCTDAGKVRSVNQDRLHYQVLQGSEQPPLALLVVADGMGGHQAGEVASRLAVETVARELREVLQPPRTSGQTRVLRVGQDVGERLESAVHRANQVLLDYARHKPEEAGDLGSTLTLAVVQGERLTLAHVGDSRAYLWRRGDLAVLTEDHSLARALVQSGQLDPAGAHDHPQRHVLYRCLGLRPDVEVDLIQADTLRPGDRLLLCSDGLWDMVTAAELSRLLASDDRPILIARRLVEAANAAGGDDNIAALVARVEAR